MLQNGGFLTRNSMESPSRVQDTLTLFWSPSSAALWCPAQAGSIVDRGGIRSRKSRFLRSGGKVLMFMLAWEITEENTRVLTRLLILIHQTRSHLPRASSSFIQSSHLLPLSRASLSSHLFTTIRGSSARSLSPLALGRDHGLESLEYAANQRIGITGMQCTTSTAPLSLNVKRCLFEEDNRSHQNFPSS